MGKVDSAAGKVDSTTKMVDLSPEAWEDGTWRSGRMEDALCRRRAPSSHVGTPRRMRHAAGEHARAAESHLDHEFLASMGVAVAKHRLQILKSPARTPPSPPPSPPSPGVPPRSSLPPSAPQPDLLSAASAPMWPCRRPTQRAVAAGTTGSAPSPRCACRRCSTVAVGGSRKAGAAR